MVYLLCVSSNNKDHHLTVKYIPGGRIITSNGGSDTLITDGACLDLSLST